MARSRRTRRGAGLFDRIKAAAAQTPLGQAAAKFRQDVAPRPAVNPYGRSAGPVGAPIPMATPVALAAPAPLPQPAPMAAPMAGPPAALSRSEAGLVSQFLYTLESGRPPTPDISPAADIAKAAVSVKNRDRNLKLLDGLAALSKDVKELIDAGTPQTVPFETAKLQGIEDSSEPFTQYETLSDPAVRARVARAVVSAQDPRGKPNERRFLPGTINQIAAAVRMAMQKKLLLGGKTRRARKVRRQTRRRV